MDKSIDLTRCSICGYDAYFVSGTGALCRFHLTIYKRMEAERQPADYVPVENDIEGFLADQSARFEVELFKQQYPEPDLVKVALFLFTLAAVAGGLLYWFSAVIR